MPIVIKRDLSEELTRFIKTKLLRYDLVVLPTETVYGLAGLGTSVKSAKKIYLLKKRPLNKKLIFHCSNLKMVNKFFKLDDENLILGRKFWAWATDTCLKKKIERNTLIIDLK